MQTTTENRASTLPAPPPGVTVRKTYLVSGVCPMPGSTRAIAYRYPTARQAHKVARDFTGPGVAVSPVYGYMTHEGWVQVQAPAQQGGAA